MLIVVPGAFGFGVGKKRSHIAKTFTYVLVTLICHYSFKDLRMVSMTPPSFYPDNDLVRQKDNGYPKVTKQVSGI